MARGSVTAPNRRKFGKKYYYVDTTHSSASKAEQYAKKARNEGYNARVVEFANGYGVYLRKK